MKDIVADQAAERLLDFVATMQVHGLRKESIIAGIEAGLKRLKEGEEGQPLP